MAMPVDPRLISLRQALGPKWSLTTVIHRPDMFDGIYGLGMEYITPDYLAPYCCPMVYNESEKEWKVYIPKDDLNLTKWIKAMGKEQILDELKRIVQAIQNN